MMGPPYDWRCDDDLDPALIALVDRERHRPRGDGCDPHQGDRRQLRRRGAGGGHLRNPQHLPQATGEAAHTTFGDLDTRYRLVLRVDADALPDAGDRLGL